MHDRHRTRNPAARNAPPFATGELKRLFPGRRPTALLASMLLAVLLALGVTSAGASAAPALFVARGGSDAVSCSANSKAAPFATIQRALSCSGDGDVISLAPTGSSSYPGIGTVSDDVVIEAQAGADARTVTIDAGRAPAERESGQLHVQPGADVTIAGVTLSCITDGCAAPAPQPTVTNEGTLTLESDTISGNTSVKGGVLNTTPENSATPASLTVEASTISGNYGSVGGGISSNAGNGATGSPTLVIANSTVADNIATSTGGGIWVGSAGTAVITNSTIVGNAGGGLVTSGKTELANTIIAANTAKHGFDTDCKDEGAKAIDAPAGHNLIGIGDGCHFVNAVNGDQVGSAPEPIRPGLAPLADDGGPTETAPPLADSPAIAAGSVAGCEGWPVFEVDQRGDARNAAGRGVCDVGAVDTGGTTVAQAAPAITSMAATRATASSPMAFTVTATGAPTPAFTETGTLPAGLTLHDNGDGTATLAGTPAAGSAGTYPITITAANGVGPDAAQAFTLTDVNLAVSKLKPATVAPGTQEKVTITGSGFEPGASVSSTVPGVTFSAVKVKSPTSITAELAVPANAALGSYAVNVVLPGTQAGCAACLTIALPPAVSGISPGTIAHGTTMVVTISGNGFLAPAKVAFTGPGRGVRGTVTAVTPTAVTVKVTVPEAAVVGSYALKLTNGDGLVSTLAGALSVT